MNYYCRVRRKKFLSILLIYIYFYFWAIFILNFEKNTTYVQIGHFFSFYRIELFFLELLPVSKLVNITYVLLQQELVYTYILRFCGWPNNDKKHSKITKTNIVISWDAHLSMQLQEIKPRARCALKFIIPVRPHRQPSSPTLLWYLSSDKYTTWLHINIPS